jgi:hypothetical protein
MQEEAVLKIQRFFKKYQVFLLPTPLLHITLPTPLFRARMCVCACVFVRVEEEKG